MTSERRDSALEMIGFELMQAYVDAHNRGVRTGAFSSLGDLLHAEVELRFEGVDVGPFHGRDAVVEAFARRPPTDELQVSNLSGDQLEVTATYSWLRQPEIPAGLLRLEVVGDTIGRLTVTTRPTGD